jgi:hypothetical protein
VPYRVDKTLKHAKRRPDRMYCLDEPLQAQLEAVE